MSNSKMANRPKRENMEQEEYREDSVRKMSKDHNTVYEQLPQCNERFVEVTILFLYFSNSHSHTINAS